MSYETILYEERGPVAVITYNRPEKRNAWNVPMVRETIDAIKRVNASDGLRAFVLTAAGTVYCAGVDFKAPPEPKDESGRSPSAASLTMGQGDHNWLNLFAASKPNVIAVNGAAIGLGLTQILAADVRIAAQSASFAFPFLKLKAMPECGCSWLLPRLIGFGRALDLVMRSATIDAEEAQRIGLVARVVPDAELREEAIKYAELMASYPALQVGLTKRMFYDNVGETSADAVLKRENAAFVAMFKAIRTTGPSHYIQAEKRSSEPGASAPTK